ncbi:hypothetical protein Tco_0967407 [Tanacetum coccineum]
MRPDHPPSPDYVPGPEHPPSIVYVPYVLEPAYPVFMPPEDDVFPAEEQPLPTAVSPTSNSLGYITESDPKEDPEEEDDEDPKEDPVDYPADRDDDDDEEESSGDDADDEGEDEEEHLAPADSVPPPAYRTTTRMSIRTQTPIPFPSEAEVDRLLAIPTPPSSPLTPLSSPLPRIPSPPFPVPSPPTTSPTYTEAPLGYRAAGIRLRTSSPPQLPLSSPLPLLPPIILPRTRASKVMMKAAAPSTYILSPRLETPPSETPPLLPIPLPTSSPPLLLPSTNCKADVPEVTLPPRKRLCIAPGPRYKIGECLSAPIARPTRGFRADYGFVGTLDAEIKRGPYREIGYGITDDTDEIYRRLDDAQDDRSLMSGQLNLVCRDRCSHARMARLMKSEARASHEAWVQSMDASDMTRSEVRALLTTILAQQTEIRDLRAADRRR